MSMVTYPLNNIEYTAEDAELFHLTRTSGVYATNAFNYSVTGADNTIVIETGIAWIKNSEFSGKVVAQKAPISLDMGLPDSVYPRIDAVVIQFDANKNGTEIVVKRGVAASAPAAPSVSQTESLYELHLYHVRREPGASAVSASNITDLRLDPNYCGLMADSVTQIDTAAISAQVNALIESLRQQIQSVKDGSAYLLRSGGEMSGPINMNGQAIKGLNAPTEDDEAVNWGSVKNAAGVGIPLPLGLEYGGVGATDPKTARENLQITPENIGAMSMELLWENASPNSNFSSQTININLSGYDFLIIEFLTYVKSADYADYHRTVITRVGIKDNVSGFGETGSYFCFRGFTSNNSGITFETGHYADKYNDDDLEDSNNLYVPQKIYGIKGVSA